MVHLLDMVLDRSLINRLEETLSESGLEVDEFAICSTIVRKATLKGILGEDAIE